MRLDENCFDEFVYAGHLGAFIRAAQTFRAYIMVRKTGKRALHWVGVRGYTAKRADMKCKTANEDVGPYKLAGLVCSPAMQPFAFNAERRADAMAQWKKCQHLITIPENNLGFNELDQFPCKTPYILQTNPKNKHYGCLAWVEYGLVTPRYVHGDYDLYAIVPADDPSKKEVRQGQLNSGMTHPSLTLARRLQLDVQNFCGPLQFQIMNWLDKEIGYPMVMHGEQENFAHNDEPVIVFLPKPRNGVNYLALENGREIEQLYAQEFGGRPH